MAKRGPKPRKHTKKSETETTALEVLNNPAELIPYLAEDLVDSTPVILALVPPDLTRCQCEWADQSMPTFGPKPLVRCEAVPEVVAFQKRHRGEAEPTGAMSLCEEHRTMIEHMFPGQCYFRKVTTEKKIGSYIG